ncbi:acyl-CoA thioesterase [Sandaracinobacter sp. RS1-74]|uniref:acyl-CoA thioesterase n=1 Tax=Sandaracinobacteroides sayramensis TaxID=2913411 RepID=UPI001EDBDDC0|nr:acyl-CoA thioesterase [Sandaracinobacteroides sayramensis]MCG2841893.1 acyl-CoA thioesterase [Sandaracinobacteroides sayramensis]
MSLKTDGWRLSPDAYPVRLTIPTRFGDMDTNAHLNNVAIARLVEESRVRFHYALHEEGGEVSPGGVMVAHVSIDYLGEGEYPADVESAVGIAAIGGSSYRIAIGLFQKGRAFALAESVMVNVRPGRAGAAPIPPGLRTLLGRYAVVNASG